MKHTRKLTALSGALAIATLAGLSTLPASAMQQIDAGQSNGKVTKLPSQGKASSSKQQAQGPVTGFIVRFKSGSRLATAAATPAGQNGLQRAQQVAATASRVAAELSNSVGVELKFEREMALQRHFVFDLGKRLNSAEKARVMQQLQDNPEVEFVEENRMLHIMATPDDTRYSDQWHYYEATGGLNAPAAWDVTDGSGSVVAVLDTGYRPHADLAANILPGYDMISNSFVGNDGDGRDSDPKDPGDWTAAGQCGNGYPAQDQDSSWHGTHVAGTIAAVTNNNNGVAGVAYGAKVVPVRVLGRCGGTTADIADAIIWASGGSVPGVPTNNNPADVINMSLGGQGACSSTTQQAINTARANGTALVIAAGNSNDNSANYNPGNCSGVINVAATDRNGGRSYYSNYGSNVDVAGPGGAMSSATDPNGILSTYNTGTTTPGSDTYGYLQGTSMATPHVAGVAALIKAADPTATPDDIENILKQTTRTFPGTCNGCGTGIVDAGAAVQAAAGGGTGGGTGGNGTLENGVAETNLSGAQGSEQFFTLDVPSGATDLTFTMSGGTGDADLYVQFGSDPTTSSYDCRPYKSGNNETCTISNVQAGTYHVMIRGYQAYSGVSLVGQYTDGSSGGGASGGGGTVENISASTGNWKYYTVDVPAGMSSLDVSIYGGTGDADLYVQFGSNPTTSSYECRPYLQGNNETCNISNPQAGTYHIGIRAYQSFSGVTLDAYYAP